MSKNGNLHQAKNAKNDEFYTTLSDIEKELKHYKEQFKGKVVYCNCDDARESNFFKYFTLNFEHLGLKKLICTGYKESNLIERNSGVVYIYEGDKNGNRVVDEDEIQIQYLQGDGDFRSKECVEFLKEADIVVTNPPFSLGREYFAQLFEYGKKFLFIMNSNAITYKEVFPYIKNGMLWTGYTQPKSFQIPSNEISNEKTQYESNGKVYQKFGNICWFTNLCTTKAENPTPICKRYNENDYPHYDNYNAIEVSKISEMPIDIPVGGVVGVPITIVDKIASDGLIYFDDGGLGGGLQTYSVEKFRKGDDDNDLTYTHTHTHGFSRTSESLSSVSSSRVRPLCGSEYNAEQENAYQREGSLCESPYQAYRIVGHEHDINGNNGEGVLGGQFEVNKRGVYKRILIQRIK